MSDNVNKIMIEYPDTLTVLLQESPKEFEREAIMAMTVKLFELK